MRISPFEIAFQNHSNSWGYELQNAPILPLNIFLRRDEKSWRENVSKLGSFSLEKFGFSQSDFSFEWEFEWFLRQFSSVKTFSQQNFPWIHVKMWSILDEDESLPKERIWFYNNECVASCPSESFQDSATPCADCNGNCLECSGTDTFCTSCDTGGAVPWLYNNVCYGSCPSGSYQVSGTACASKRNNLDLGW